MRNVKIVLWTTISLAAVLLLLAETIPRPLTYFSFRSVAVQYTGVTAIAVMSVAMILAARPQVLEPYLNGLDKMYRLHKWLGVAGLVFAVAHWWLAQGTKWMVGWGWLTRPDRRPRGGQELGAIQGWLRDQRGLAESLGEWAFYAAAILIVLALIPRFPYRWFIKSHKWLAVAYPALVFHSVVLMRFSYWTQPVGWLLALLMLGGTAASVLVLLGRVGHSRKAQGTIESLIYYPSLHVLEAEIQLRDGWSGHEGGQFAFVTSERAEGAHPFTIASAWDPANPRIVFIAKELGDYTRTLQDRLHTGTEVTVEGPYGCFTFNDNRPRQIWIGGGIGITPFIGRMKQLALSPGSQIIDLFHPTTDCDPDAVGKLSADARAANVKLHVLRSPQEGLLDGEQIRAAVPEWKTASLWFCGPPAFGAALRKDFLSHGFMPADFHYELFQMR